MNLLLVSYIVYHSLNPTPSLLVYSFVYCVIFVISFGCIINVEFLVSKRLSQSFYNMPGPVQSTIRERAKLPHPNQSTVQVRELLLLTNGISSMDVKLAAEF